MKNYEYRLIESMLHFWKTGESLTIWDDDNPEGVTISPPKELKVWARIWCKRNNPDMSLEDEICNAIENDTFGVDVLESYNGITESIKIPEKYVRDYVLVYGVNFDLLEYDERKNIVSCDSNDVILLRDKIIPDNTENTTEQKESKE